MDQIAIALSSASAVLALVGIALAVGALRFSPPVISATNSGPDRWTITNQGPGPAVFLSATVQDPSGAYPIREYEREHNIMLSDDERLFGYDSDDGRGWVMPPQLPFDVVVGVNSDLTIRYRAKGFFGWFGSATIQIEGVA